MALPTGLTSLVSLTAGSHGAGYAAGPLMFAPFVLLLLILAVGAVGFAVLRSTGGGDDASQRTTDAALDALRRRYAAGEIDDEEFQTRKERLVR